ncbi:MAG: hypothetical protein V4670_00375 [Bacteroidota bacterium]
MTDTLQTNFDKKEKESLEKRKKIKEQDYIDSLRNNKILQKALKIAYQSISKDKFVEKYEISSDSIQMSVEINLNYHFTKTKPHLIIRRNEPNTIYFDIYSKNNGKYEKVISHEQWALTYVNDTIKDVNGDGLNDFVVNWYGATGCCLKAFSNVYLLRQDKKTFSEIFEFINPTFAPKERIIRGICYGHPGETEMYKYKWKGESIDTIEYVTYQTKKDDSSVKTGKIIISNNGQQFSDKFKIIKILNDVPNEYKKIDGYDWFTGNGY